MFRLVGFLGHLDGQGVALGSNMYVRLNCLNWLFAGSGWVIRAVRLSRQKRHKCRFPRDAFKRLPSLAIATSHLFSPLFLHRATR